MVYILHICHCVESLKFYLRTSNQFNKVIVVNHFQTKLRKNQLKKHILRIKKSSKVLNVSKIGNTMEESSLLLLIDQRLKL